MTEDKVLTTTFQISRSLHDKMKMMCVFTHKSMGEFIRIAIRDKIAQLKLEKNDK